MFSPDFQQNYFELFSLPVAFELDQAQLGVRYRKLQGKLHPDRYASAPALEQRLAVQYSALVNEAYTALRKPMRRALYLLKLAGMGEEEIGREQIGGGFLMMQIDLREKLESIPGLVDPDIILDHVVTEIREDIVQQQQQFAEAYAAGDLSPAAKSCVKIQYLAKLLLEAEQIESDLMDN
jgi:molecular chaperone HscB